MAKRKTGNFMTPGERIAGTVFLVIYLAVLPLVTGPFFRLLSRLLGISISRELQNLCYYYLLFAVTVILFHGFLVRTSRNFADNLGVACKSALLGLVALYGLNELSFRLLRALGVGQTNLNDSAVSAQVQGAPRTTILIVVLLAPFVEEVLFRGLVFGNLRRKSRAVAYAVSCALFALAHVWQFAVGNHDLSYFLVMLQYLVPGAVLAWSFEHTGTLWTAVAVHAAANALAVWTAG